MSHDKGNVFFVLFTKKSKLMKIWKLKREKREFTIFNYYCLGYHFDTYRGYSIYLEAVAKADQQFLKRFI